MTLLSGISTRLRRGLLLAAGAAAFATPPASAADGAMSASYTISIAGIPVGRADAEGRFNQSGYSIAIRGFTSSVGRLVSDATATLRGNGRISGTNVTPASFSLATTENGLSAAVNMTMRGRSIAALSAQPELAPRPDRIPVTNAHKRDVRDPVSAFIVALRGGPVSGETACNRTIPVFDGWQRYDVRLSYQRTRNVQGDDSTYSGQVIVCSARYVPVAGHRPDQESVRYMAANTHLEAWLIPVQGQRIMIPYQIIIGTQIGDLVVRMSKFSAGAEETRAAAEVN